MSATEMGQGGLCGEVEEQLSQVLDGTAPAALFDHIAGCDACRDLRHEAAQAAEAVAVAGADFHAPADFVDRLLTKLSASTAPAAPVAPARSHHAVNTLPGPREGEAPRVSPTLPEVGGALANALPPGRVGHAGAAPRGKVTSGWRRRSFIAAAIVASAAAAGVGFFLKGRHVPEAPIAVESPWSGKVASVQRASADKAGGLEACDTSGACAPLAEGAPLPLPTTLRTDARTRAHVALRDGTELAIDRASEVWLGAGQARAARVNEGAIVADVAKLDGAPPAQITIPQGQIEVLGTKLAITTSADRASVEVARGAVRVTGERGGTVEVRAGEEATLARGGAPEVASATSLADLMEWSDRTAEEVDSPTLRGLGELRAKRPGSTQEKDHAVRLAKHAVKVRIVDVVARTEVDEIFTNDTDEELEGIFRFPLPPGAQIERLALEVDGKLVEGAFVDRDRGAAIWRGVLQNAAPKAPKPIEEIIWVPGPWRDPALLEWQRGGRFELKIFPIPRRGSRRVVLTYTELVQQAAGVRRFTYPLAHDDAGTTRIGDFSIDLQVLGHDRDFGVKTHGYELLPSSGDASADRRTMQAQGFTPAGDLTVEYALPDRDKEATAWAYRMPAPPPGEDASAAAREALAKAKTPEEKVAIDAAQAIASDTSPYVAIALRPKLPRWQEAKERLHVLVVDASRSMVGERFARATQLASSIVREMDRRDEFVLLACDTVCRSMDGAAGASRPLAPGAAAAGEVERFLGGIEPDGGSDLAAAMIAARAAAGAASGKELRVIYLGDGTPSVGPTRAAHLEAAVRSAIPGGDAAVIAVALGSDADTTSLEALARGGGGVMVPYVPGQKIATAALEVLGAAYGLALRDPEVELPAGLTQVSPARLDPIRAGGEVFVVARMSDPQVSGAIRLRGRVAGERFEQSYPVTLAASTSAGNAFVPRLYAAAKIAELERAGGEAQKPAIIALSKRFSVASRFTSLLVLESEAMFKAFGLDRSGAASAFTGEQQADSVSTDAEGDAKGEASAASAEDELGGVLGGAASRSEAKKDRGTVLMNPFDDAGGFGSGHGGFAQGPAAAAPAMPPAPAATVGPPSPAKPASKSSIACAPGDPLCSDLDRRADRGRWRPPPPPPRRMIPMRKVFDRKASFDSVNTLASQNATKLLAAESALASAPDSRDKTIGLYALYATSGRIGEAQELTARWSGRDALDPDALIARADLAARQGDRVRAVRILGGLADVRPGDKAIQMRLAELHDTASEPSFACQHRLTLADLAPSEIKLVAAAVQCARAQGMNALADMLRLDVDGKLRDALDKQLSSTAMTSSTTATTLRGDVQLTAEWTGSADLDLALIDEQGRRTSWLGSPFKAVTVTARDVMSPRTEALALVNLPKGSYVVEIARAFVGDISNDTIRGELTLRLVGETRKIPFTLTGPRLELGTMRVFFTSRLVPIDGFNFGGGWRGGF